MDIVNDYDEFFDVDELLTLLDQFIDSPSEEDIYSYKSDREGQGSQSNNDSTTISFDNDPSSNSDQQIVESESVFDLHEKGFINGENTLSDVALSKRDIYSYKSYGEGQGSQRNNDSTTISFDNDPSSNSDQQIVKSESVFYLHEKGFINGENTLSDVALSKRATGTSSSPGGQDTFLQSRDSHVKVWIKPFTVPGLFVEIPKTATVDDLKREIMNKVTADLEGKSHVGLLQEGKMIGDDNKTLFHAGISRDSNVEVIIEPGPSLALPPLHSGGSALLPCNVNHPPTRSLPAVPVVLQGTCDVSSDPSVANLGTLIGGDQDLVESHTAMSIEEIAHTFVPLPPISVDAPVPGSKHGKSKQSKTLQRRSPKSFSLLEVKALVEAVEILGTGRWLEIKEQAFSNVSKRTYMDLKDKWRTLVKTAKKPAKKRRGVVLPQELLNRVLAIEDLKLTTPSSNHS